MQVNKNAIADTVRTEFEKGTDSALQEFEKSAEEVRRELDRRTDGARDQLGERIVDLSEEYFPEAVARRRRRQMAVAFTAGVGAGVAARHFLGR